MSSFQCLFFRLWCTRARLTLNIPAPQKTLWVISVTTMVDKNKDKGETPEEKAEKALQAKFKTWNEQYQGHINGMRTIEESFAAYGMKPTKPSRAKATTLSAGLEKAVKEALEGKTVTAGTFDKYLRKEHEMYGQNEPLKARKALIAAGVIKQLEGQGENNTSTFVWLASETMANESEDLD
jgi:hypothetical protein